MNKTKSFFDEYSVDFNSIYATNGLLNKLINKLFRKSMLVRMQKTIDYCQPVKGKTVLDIGCGPGHYAVLFAQMGAKEVFGIDFSDKMIKIAIDLAKQKNIQQNCIFKVQDIYDLKNVHYDYTILMGFMDYIVDPKKLIKHVLNLTNETAVFSFPCSEGFLAFQRKIRYMFKCPLYLYSLEKVTNLFANINGFSSKIEKIDRDYFVVVKKHK